MNDEAMYHIGAMVGTTLRYAGIRIARAHLNEAGDREKDIVLADSCPAVLQKKFSETENFHSVSTRPQAPLALSPKCLIFLYAPLAQLDRAAGYEPVGRVFESPRAHLFFQALSAL